MGACVSVKTKKHFTIAVYEPGNFRNPLVRLVAELIPDVIVLGFCVLLTWYGWGIFYLRFYPQGNRGTAADVLGIRGPAGLRCYHGPVYD